MRARPSRTAIEKKAIEVYGVDHQIDRCIEELAELIQALLHWRRDPTPEHKAAVIEEAADAQIGLDYIPMLFGCTLLVQDAKLTRLAGNLGMLEVSE